MAKVGRPKQSGERYPSGKLKPQGSAMSGVLWRRLVDYGHQVGVDQRLASELGRLWHFRELTLAQLVAGQRIGEVYGRYERFKNLKRSLRSPSYERSYGEAGAHEDHLGLDMMTEMERQIRAAESEFKFLNGETIFLPHSYQPVLNPGKIPAKLRSIIEALCVEDRSINPMAYDDVREVLEDLAIVWKVNGSRSRSKAAGDAIQRPQLPGTPKPLKEPNLDLIYWIKVMRKLRPDLDEQQLGHVYATQQVLKQRELVRRATVGGGKSRKVVPFPRRVLERSPNADKPTLSVNAVIFDEGRHT